MPKKDVVPDAWDDDWEQIADKQGTVDTEKPQEDVPITKSQRRAQHVENNRQIWESAENPEPLLFLDARDNVPLKSNLKPSLTVLSRKPPTQVLSRNGVTSGMAGLTLEDDDSEEERRKKNEESLAERQARAQKEREEKARKYAEARERIMGSPDPSNSDNSRGRASPNRQQRGGKGRGRSGRDSQPRSSNEQSPANSGNTRKQLYDPNYSVKPNSVYIQKKEASNSRPSTPNGQHPIREPRGPQVSGRSGNGFAPRGARTGAIP